MYIDIEGKRLYYRVFGTGKPVLFLHGWGGTGSSLTPLAKRISKHNKAIVLDLPGFGKSENPDPSWGTVEYSKIVLAFITALKLSHVVLFGHSFGGGLAILLAAQNPNLVSALVLCGTSFRREGKVNPLSKVLKSIVPKRFKLLLYRIFFSKSDLSRYPHLEANFRKIVTEDLSMSAQDIHCKTLILWGDRDTYTPVKDAYILHKLIKGSTLKVYKDKGHGLPLKYPELIAPELKSFL